MEEVKTNQAAAVRQSSMRSQCPSFRVEASKAEIGMPFKAEGGFIKTTEEGNLSTQPTKQGLKIQTHRFLDKLKLIKLYWLARMT